MHIWEDIETSACQFLPKKAIIDQISSNPRGKPDFEDAFDAGAPPTITRRDEELLEKREIQWTIVKCA